MGNEDERKSPNFGFSGHLSREVQDDIAKLLRPRLKYLTISVASLAFTVGTFAYKNRHRVKLDDVEGFLSDFVINYSKALSSPNGLAPFRYPLPDDPKQSHFLASVLSKDKAEVIKVDSRLLETGIESITETQMPLPGLFVQEVSYELPGSSFWRRKRKVRLGSIIGEHNLISQLNPMQPDSFFRARIILDKYPSPK